MFRAISFAAVLAAAAAFRSYPLYKQCDPRWGSNPMGTKGNGEDSTICGEGCAMSDLSMVLAGLNISIPGEGPSSPATLNGWLESNNGYECLDGDCNNLILNAVENITSYVKLIGEVPVPPIAVLEAGLTAGNIAFLAHDVALHHFVLLTGFDTPGSGNFSVNDPYFNTTYYTYDQFGDVLMYALLE